MLKNKFLNTNGAILTQQELEKHLEKLGTTQILKPRANMQTYPIKRVMENYKIIKQTYELLNEHINLKIDIHPAGEWILDNFYIIEEAVKTIEKELTKKKYKNFVAIANGQNEGFARIYVLANEIVCHTEGKIEKENLEKYLISYQTKKALNMDEIWNIGIFLQIALIENIRENCEKIYISQIEKYKAESIIERLVEKKQNTKFAHIKTNRNIRKFKNIKYPFVEHLSYKLKKYGKETKQYLEILEEEVEKGGTTIAEIIKKEHFDIALKKVIIGNCIISIKTIQRINFLETFEKINRVEEILKKDPAGIYDKMDYKTKDYYRQKIKEISKKAKISEMYIAKKLLKLAGSRKHIGNYLFGEDKKLLYKQLGYNAPKEMKQKQKVKLYILSILLFTIIIDMLILFKLIGKINFIFIIIGFLFLLLPISEFVIQIIQYILSKFVKPKLIPKIDFSKGIDKENATIVVIPTILQNREKVKQLMRKLEVFYLANKSENLYFCLLGDCTESSKEVEDFDKEIIEEGIKQTQKLISKYGNIFYFIYRKRKWNSSQQKYLGWERKRGALTEFINLLQKRYNEKQIKDRFNISTMNMETIGDDVKLTNKNLPNCKYCITLDSDTDLILNSASELIGAMAHPLNKPKIKNKKVQKGYGLIQPRVGVNIDVSHKNMFTKIFVANGGIDSYTNAISDIYQDNFGEGIFTGKGIFDIKLYEEILKDEIPENTVLSHDLLEGCYLRCGLATDILLMDGFPTKYTSFIKRLSRWIRGDWQIARWIKSNKMNLLSKFKIFDNLRRSLIEINIIICAIYFLALSKFGNINSNGIILFLLFTIILPFLLEILNIIIFKKEGEQKQKGFSPTIGGIKGAIYKAALGLGCLPFKAYISLKSICIAIYRMMFSKCKLLEWVTSEEAEKNAENMPFEYYRLMWINVVFGILTIFSFNILWLILGFLWIITPLIMCDISTEKEHARKSLNKDQKQYILEIAKKTFSYFKDNLTEENNFLVPDNFQQDRKQKYIDRTSSTNIGLSLLAVIAGVDLEFISYKEGIKIISNIIETVENLEKWNGHLYNWYNIKTKMPLIPKYVSTVDSGNFVGYLYVLKNFVKDENLKNRISKLIDDTDFSKLYSKEHRLFSIGFNIEENKLTDSYYDLLATEARQASLVAIAKKDVSSKHWNNLNRTLTILNNKKGLISWSGTAFEYLMPNIIIPKFEGSILDESSKFAIMSQMEYAKKLKIPWGISEAAFNVKDLHSNYQYKAFGIPWLGLKRGLADEIVVAPYASFLAITENQVEVYKNIKELEKYGMKDKYGFYESIDFSIQRLKRGEKFAIVKTYMAHHQALILLCINNLINKNIFQKRFMQNPEIEAIAILLQEKMPDTFIVTKDEKEKQTKLRYQDYENYAQISYNNSNSNLIRGNVISNENYMVAINTKGEGVSKYKNIYINRYKNTDDYKQGIFFYVKNINTKQVWSNAQENTTITFMPDQNKMERIDGNIKTTMQMTLDTDEPIEIRRLKLENVGQREETLEVWGMFEPILSTKNQDYAHPAFNNLFLKFDYDYDNHYLEVSRRKRNKDEMEINMIVKFYAEEGAIVDNEFEISREKLDERGNIGIPNAIINSLPLSNKAGLVTEPLIAMRKTIKILPNEIKYLDLIISVNENKEIAIQNIQKYDSKENIKRIFEISKAKIDAENRYLGINAKEIILYQKIMSYIIFENPLRKRQMKNTNRLYNQAELWKYGISGDLPIILVKIKDINDIYIIKNILKMYEFFRAKNLFIDIVFLDEEKHSYENFVKGEIEAKISDKHLDYMKNVKSGIFVLSKNEMSIDDVQLLNFVSSLVIDTHKGDLYHIIKDMEDEYLSKIQNVENRTFENIFDIDENQKQENILEKQENLKYYNEYGAFSYDGKEYMICQNKEKRLPNVWSHILANEKFGTVITENMGGYTWFKNSRLNKITAWHNKPFMDIPSEIIYMQNEENGNTWSLGENPMPDNNNYNIIYGFGYAKYIHLSDEIYQELEVFVPNKDSVKIGILKLNNKSLLKKKIRIIYFVKPVLGEDETKSNEYIKTHFDKNANIVYAQNLYENGFKTIMYLSSSEKIKSFTGDKKSFLGKGNLANPDGLKKYCLNNEDGIGKMPCLAIEIEVELESLATKEIVFTLGAEENVVDLKNIAYKYSKLANCKQELEDVKKKWKNILEILQVTTPIESINIILNGWALYQTISSRLIGRTGFYQSGGAFGFRDQLQDTMALKYIEPEMVKKQIIKHSKHQFIEGDVEHWWHDEIDHGIRTRFSDDLLWLSFMVEQYIEATGDKTILDIETPYLEGEPLKDEQNERYDFYPQSNIKETIYMHCVRAIDKSMSLGKNGLPKIGTGDWNDGFSRVGNKGKGESIWLGFFLYDVLINFIEICKYKNDEKRANVYSNFAETLRKNLNAKGWDGRWFKRAYTDDGDILGSIENDECRIDSISQSWSVISGAGDNDKKFISMESLENHLVDRENGIIKLLDPPFENGKLDPGYIKSYLPGVRENGGQYTHAAIWAIIAEAMLGFGDKATEFYRMINPIEHSRTNEAIQKYKVEPYSIPADVYGSGNLVGRGGWTWYTGSSSWYYVAGVEYILGFKIKNNVLFINPCIPKGWNEFFIKFKFKNSVYNIHVLNPDGKERGVSQIIVNGEEGDYINKGIALNGDGGTFDVEVVL